MDQHSNEHARTSISVPTDRHIGKAVDQLSNKLTKTSMSVPTDRHTSQLRVYFPTDRHIDKAMDQHSSKHARTIMTVPTDRQTGQANLNLNSNIFFRGMSLNNSRKSKTEVLSLLKTFQG
jgi:hypothetical protein